MLTKEHGLEISNYKYKLTEMTNGCKMVYASLKELTKETIDERDWESVDLLIYLVETRRADNVKEALQQLDTYKFRGELLNVVRESVKYMSERLDERLNNLGNSLSRAFSALSSQMTNSLGSLGSKIDEANSYTKSLISEQKLTNNLHKKAANEMKDISKDLTELKNYEKFGWY